MSMIHKERVYSGATLALMLALCAGICLSAAADASADSVMLKKPTAASQPTHSFLLDVVPVKETKAAEPKSSDAAAKPAQAVPAPAPAKVAAEEKPAAPAPAPVKTVAEEKPTQAKPAVVAETPKPAVEEKPAAPVVPVEKKAAPADSGKKDAAKAKGKDKGKAKGKGKEKQPARDAIITAERTDYDRKEGVVLFDRNVHVDDTQYQMHADRLFLFLEGTNELKRLVAIGHVAITNEDKRAYCARATFNKKLGRVVMYSSDEITAELREEGKKGSDVKGEKITFWLDSEQVEVENPVITMPGGIGGQGSMKKLIGK